MDNATKALKTPSKIDAVRLELALIRFQLERYQAVIEALEGEEGKNWFWELHTDAFMKLEPNRLGGPTIMSAKLWAKVIKHKLGL